MLDGGRFMVAVDDALSFAADAYAKYRDLVASDGIGLNPAEGALREGLRAACRYMAEGDAVYTRLARAASDFVCSPLYDEPGNAPAQPPFTGGQCAVQYRCFLQVIADQGNSPPGGPDSGTGTGPVSLEYTETQFLKTYRVKAANGANIVVRSQPASATGVRAVVSVQRLDGLPDTCGDPPSELPVVSDPYAPNTPLPTPIGPVTVTPGPGGPIIRLPDGTPVPIPFDPTAPTGTEPPTPDDPITPNPPQAPDGDGDVDFGDPPPGYEWAGAYYRMATPHSYIGRWSGQPQTPVLYEVAATLRLRHDSAKLGQAHLLYSAEGLVLRGGDRVPVDGARVWENYPVGLQVQGVAVKIAETTET